MNYPYANWIPESSPGKCTFLFILKHPGDVRKPRILPHLDSLEFFHSAGISSIANIYFEEISIGRIPNCLKMRHSNIEPVFPTLPLYLKYGHASSRARKDGSTFLDSR